MAIRADFDKKLENWIAGGILDRATAEKLRAYEAVHAKPTRGLMVIAVSFGAIMLGAGILLFVAAHWDELSPGERISLVLAMVAVFHVTASFFGERWTALHRALHGVGTIALGGGIFLAGQIFNLQEHWPGGIMLWAVGALLGVLLLRDWVQSTLLALLAPAWIFSEWAERIRLDASSARLLAMGVAALALVYFTSVIDSQPTAFRSALRWIGGIQILPAFIILFVVRDYSSYPEYHSLGVRIFGYILFLGGAFVVSAVLQRRIDLWTAGMLAWTGVLCSLGAFTSIEIASYVWTVIGCIAFIFWGLAEHRTERINMGVAGFSITVMAFYFSSVMDKLDRSFALMLFGVFFLLGGWFLEKMRRQLVARVREAGA
jgi:uncharacterized membrane protein